MFMDGLKCILIFISALIFSKMSFASEYVEVPIEELAKESVLPVFDQTVAVKSRNIKTQEKIDIGLFYGMAMTEPIQNVSKLGMSAYYHLDENQAIGAFLTMNSSGLSTYANQLKEVKGADGSTIKLDLTRAPIQKSALMLDYNVKAYYGKMSLSKNTVFNLSLYGTGAIGLVQFSHKSFPAIALGLGQKFYFSKNFSFRFDMRLYAHNAPIPFLADHTRVEQPAAPHSDYKDRLTLTTNLDAGISYLF